MSRIWVIARHELRLFLKSRVSYVWLFVIPLLFMVMMSIARYGSGKTENRFPPVLLENRDAGHVGAHFVEVLKQQGLWELDPAKDQRNKPVCAVRIPADFTARLAARESTNVEFAKLGDGQADQAIIEVRVMRALVALNSDLLEAGAALPAGAFPDAAQLKAVRAKPDPVMLEATYAGKRPVPTGFNYSVPGNLVNFLLMNLLIFGGSAVSSRRRDGTLRRLTTLPVRRSQLVAGQLLGLWLLGLVQVVFFLLLGRFAFQVNLGANLPGVLLVLMLFAWVAAGLGVFVGSAVNAPERVIGLCVFASLVMAAVGGCWFPLEITPPWMQTLGHCTPTGWALDALHHLISFGHGLDAIGLHLAVLAGCALAATAAAAKFFRV